MKMHKRIFLSLGIILASTPLPTHTFLDPNLGAMAKEHYDTEAKICGVSALASLVASGYLLHTGINQRSWWRIGAGITCAATSCLCGALWANSKLTGIFVKSYLDK